MNSAASLAAGLPVGRRAVRLAILAAYALPAVAAWALLGFWLGAASAALPGVRVVALAAAACYGGYYGTLEASGRRGLAPPGRGWQVPQTMLIDAPPGRRLALWGALLGPGLLTRNPFAGFGLLPLAVTAMPGPAAAVALGAAAGLAHGIARAAGLVRDLRELSAWPAPASAEAQALAAVALAGAGAGPGGAEHVPAHLDMVLKTIYWRRFDGVLLLAVAATGFAASVRSFT